MMKIDQICENSPVESIVSYIGNVCKLSSIKVTSNQLRYKEAVVKDDTAQIRVVFWQEALHLTDEDRTYNFIEFKSQKSQKQQIF